jgi:C4-dicarboxylate-specific signal transduction histidine kinase
VLANLPCQVPLRELREGASLQYEIETRYQRKDGTSLPVNAYLSVVNRVALAEPAFLLVTADIAARRAAEDAVRAAQSELTRAARLRTVSTMAASIAHEINQPLASIVMNANAGLRWRARSEPSLEEARSAFGRIVNDGHRATQIITGMRAMFRKESTERSPVAINELICDVVATSLGELKSRHVSLTPRAFRRPSADSGRPSATSAGPCESCVECNRLNGFGRRSSTHAYCAFRAA